MIDDSYFLYSLGSEFDSDLIDEMGMTRWPPEIHHVVRHFSRAPSPKYDKNSKLPANGFIFKSFCKVEIDGGNNVLIAAILYAGSNVFCHNGCCKEKCEMM